MKWGILPTPPHSLWRGRMKKSKVSVILSIVLLLSFMLTACQPAAEQAPAEPAATEPAAPAATPFEPWKVEAPDCNYGGEFKSIESVDEYTVKFTLCAPDAAFGAKVPIPAFYIQDKDFLDANGGDAMKMNASPNGTGPYVLKEWIQGDHITFEANPSYWGEAAKTKTLVFRWSAEASQRLLEIQAGTVDGIDNPTPDDFATIEGDANLNLIPRPGLNTGYIGLNSGLEPFDDVKVRQAFAMAIDQQRIVDNYYPKGSITANNHLPPLISPGSSPDVKWYEYDPDTAKALLAEAGYADGLEVTLSYRNVPRTYLPLPDKVAQEVQAQLAEVGVTVNVNQMESTTFLDSVAAGNEAFFILGGNMDYPDPADIFNYNYGNPNKKNFGPVNPELMEVVLAAAQTSDKAERQAHYDIANQMIKDTVPLILLAHGTSATVFKNNVEGAHASPLNKEVFAVMSNGTDQMVWMQGAEPTVLVCPDETDDETNRACSQIYEPLLMFAPGTADLVPALAEKWEANADATVWTFNLRKDVKFHNGAALDANDVVATFVSQWDAKSPNHVGRTGSFEYFGALFGNFMNAE